MEERSDEPQLADIRDHWHWVRDGIQEILTDQEQLTFIPEDVFFSKSMIDFNIGKVADWEIARNFSQETQLSKNPLGGHQFWLAGQHNIVNSYNLVYDEYYKEDNNKKKKEE